MSPYSIDFDARQGQSGFSLLEVLVAFAILALVLGVVMQIFSSGLQNIDTSAEYQQAIGLAQNKLASLGIEMPLVEGETQGAFDSRYRWRASVKLSPETQQRAASVAALPVALYEIEIKVFWGDTVHPRTTILKTLRLSDKTTS